MRRDFRCKDTEDSEQKFPGLALEIVITDRWEAIRCFLMNDSETKLTCEHESRSIRAWTTFERRRTLITAIGNRIMAARLAVIVNEVCGFEKANEPLEVFTSGISGVILRCNKVF